MGNAGDGVSPNPEKVQALREATRPENKAELMSFLCMLQSSSEFIPHLSKETVHLRELTKKAVRFKWTEECQKEFTRHKLSVHQNYDQACLFSKRHVIFV